MILICFTINSVCAQSLDNLNCADNNGFENQNIIDEDLHKDSSLKSLKSSVLNSEKKTTNNAVKKTSTTNSTAKKTNTTSAKKTSTTNSTAKKTNTTKATTNNSSTKKAAQTKENITSMNTKTLAKSSSGFMTYVEKNGKLQDPITISNKKYKASEYLYLVSKAVSNISKTKVEIKDKLITNYSNTNCKSVNGTINKTEYVQLAKKTVSFIEKNHRAPNWVSSSKGKIPRNQLILAFSKCLDYYNNNSKLPSSIKLNDLDLNKIKQKVDSGKQVNSTKKTNTTITKKTNTTSTKTNTTNKNNSAKKTNTTSTKKTNTTKASNTNNKTLVETTLDSIQSILNNIVKKLNPSKNEVSASKTNEKTVSVDSGKVNVKVSSTTSVNVKVTAKNNTKASTTSAKKTNTTSTKKTNTTSAKKTNPTSTKKTNTTSAKKTNTTSTKKTNTTTNSAKKTNTTTNSAKKTNTSSSLTKYLNTSILNDKYLGDSLKKYLSASKNCQVNNNLIKSLAKNLTSKVKTEYKKGEKIFNWVRDNIGYEKYRNTKKGALQTLKSRGANCVDHAHLVVALSRAAGLPARYVNANNCKFSSGYVSGHVWAQVLVGNTWVVADTTSSRNKFGVVNNWNVKSYKLVGKYSSISF